MSNKEYGNIDFELKKKKNNKMRERKKVPFIDFFLCNPQEQTQIYAETNYLIVFLQKLYL